MRKTIILFLLCFLVAISIPVSSQAKKDIGIKTITVVSGPVGGSWYPIGAKLGEIFEKEFKLKATVDIGGSAQNVRRVDAGRDADVGLASAPEAWNAHNGFPPFKKKHTNYSILGNIAPYTYQVLVRKGTGITSWKDLKGKRISPGKAGLGGEILTRKILEEVGLSYDKIRKAGGAIEFRDYRSAIEAMKDGNLDTVHITMPYPIPLYQEYFLTNKGSFLPLKESLRGPIINKYPVYSRAELPAGIYKGQNSPVPTIAYWTTFIVRADLPASVVYELTKALYKHESEIRELMPALKPFGIKKAVEWRRIPVHPGAKKYFQEVGIWKD
jgi:TRAP transporter TAXI family solute receptor